MNGKLYNTQYNTTENTMEKTNYPQTVTEKDLVEYCFNHMCHQCIYQKACQNFCEHYVFYPAVLTIDYKNTWKYDGIHPEREWDNV